MAENGVVHNDDLIPLLIVEVINYLKDAMPLEPSFA
jgi:hypothetical protein